MSAIHKLTLEIGIGLNSRLQNYCFCYAYGFYCRDLKPISDQCFYHTETSQLFCVANHWTGFYMIEKLLINGLLKENFWFSGKVKIEFIVCERRMNLVKIKNPFMYSVFLTSIFLSIDTKVSKRVTPFCGRQSDVEGRYKDAPHPKFW